MLPLRFFSRKVKPIRMALRSKADSSDVIHFNRHDRAVTLILHRPRALHALNINMIQILTELYRTFESDKQTSVIILKGAGDKAFCAGGDIVEICHSGKTGSSLCFDFFREEYLLDHYIATLSCPHVAILNGITLGGGVGISVHGKFRVATEQTVFAMPETAIGFFPDVGGSYFLPRLKGSLGMFFGLTGTRLKGKHVAAAGVATHYVPQELIPQLEERLGTVPERSDKAVKAILDEFSQPSDWEGSVVGDNITLINHAFSQNSVENIIKTLQTDASEFSQSLLQTLGKMSPTSLKVTFEQIRRGKQLSLEECLQMELALTQQFMKGKDFYEGVNELLITKTNKPRWDPPTLEKVNPQDVQSYFQPLDRSLNPLNFKELKSPWSTAHLNKL